MYEWDADVLFECIIRNGQIRIGQPIRMQVFPNNFILTPASQQKLRTTRELRNNTSCLRSIIGQF